MSEINATWMESLTHEAREGKHWLVWRWEADPHNKIARYSIKGKTGIEPAKYGGGNTLAEIRDWLGQAEDGAWQGGVSQRVRTPEDGKSLYADYDFNGVRVQSDDPRPSLNAYERMPAPEKMLALYVLDRTKVGIRVPSIIARKTGKPLTVNLKNTVITPEMMRQHLEAGVPHEGDPNHPGHLLGYTVTPRGNAVYAAVDFDVHAVGGSHDGDRKLSQYERAEDAMADAVKAHAIASEMGLTPWIEISKGGGCHLWVYMQPVLGRDAKEIATLIRDRTQMHPDIEPHKAGIEIFPKQELADKAGCGNGLYLPWSGLYTRLQPPRQVFVDPVTFEPLLIEQFLSDAYSTRATAQQVANILTPIRQAKQAEELKRNLERKKRQDALAEPGRTSRIPLLMTNGKSKQTVLGDEHWQAELAGCAYLLGLVDTAEAGKSLGYTEWQRLGMSLKLFGEWGQDEWHRLSALDAAQYNRMEAQVKWDSFSSFGVNCDAMGCGRDRVKDCKMPGKNVSPVYFAYKGVKQTPKGDKLTGPEIAKMLLGMAREDIRSYHVDTESGEPYVSLCDQNNLKTMLVASTRFSDYLYARWEQWAGSPPPKESVITARRMLEAQVRRNGTLEPVYTRLGYDANTGKIYIDLGREDWAVVEIDAQGWRVVAPSPVPFRRPPGLAALPDPILGGSLADLRPYINAQGDAWTLYQASLVGSLCPWGSYTVTLLSGEQGSAKSTATRFYKLLIDPNTAPSRAQPQQESAVFLSARNGWVSAWENLSRMPEWMSDVLCSICTGGGRSARKLYSDSEESIIQVKRPIVMNSIADVIERGDLLDRAVLVELQPMGDRRIEEKILDERFLKARPRIMGALYSAVSMALRRHEDLQIERLPRMADFYKWVMAAEPALDMPEGEFAKAYGGNVENATNLAMESSPLASLVMQWWDGPKSLQDEVKMTSSVLYDDLLPDWKDGAASKMFPKNASALVSALMRLAPTLREHGLDISRARGTGGARCVTLKRVGAAREPPIAGTRPGSEGGVMRNLHPVPVPVVLDDPFADD